MKTKLLKKVRNDYKIIHYPEGYKSEFGFSYFENAYVLYFKNEILRAEFCKKSLIDYLVDHLKSTLEVESTNLA